MPRPLCLAASSAIFCQRCVFFESAFSSGRDTQRAVTIGWMRRTPSSTAFCTTQSILSPFKSAWHSVTCTEGSAKLLQISKIRTRTASGDTSAISPR